MEKRTSALYWKRSDAVILFSAAETFQPQAGPGGRGAAAEELFGVCAGEKWPVI